MKTKSLGAVRTEHEAGATKHLRQAQRLVSDARSRSHCAEPPLILAMAAEHAGAAMEAWRGVGAEWARGRKRSRSRALNRAIVRVTSQIHKAMHDYATGPCVLKAKP